MGLSAIALFWLSRLGMRAILSLMSGFIRLFDRVLPFSPDWSHPKHTVLTLGLLLGLAVAAPWLLDWLWQQTHGLQPLSIQKLQKTHPESCRLLRRIAQKRGWTLPLLKELPTDAPLIFSYGWAPRYSRIVISRGLMNQLDASELATLMGYELTHITRRILPYMSLVALLTQALYQGYWQLARWGDRQTARVTIVIAAVGSTGCYALYWLIRKLHLPLSRVRVWGSDRQAVQWTGNPNALIRALIKLEQGVAATISQTGYTPPLVESTDLLTPIGVESALTPGSLLPDRAFLNALNWDIQNPYRRWLSFNNSHPRLGERLQRLSLYAQRWSLSPEIPFPTSTAPLTTPPRLSFWERWRAFLTQIMPYIGPVLGIIVAMLLWFLGGIFEPLGLRRIGWVYGDRSVLWGSLFLGLGMGIMTRINPYFPDITPLNRQTNPQLSTLLDDSQALPTDSRPIQLTGTLLGRTGMANWLCQDFILQTPTGLLKLHFLSVLGAFGNLLIHPQHPSEWIGTTLETQGWYRRGAIAWLDVETFKHQGRVIATANHPMWSVVLSLFFCGLGLFILLRG
jgi:Zn-dependent protease with chaperone function